MSNRISFGHVLSRNAMKNLRGGTKDYTVSCETEEGYTQTETGSCTGMTALECQTEANAWCENTKGCKNCQVS
ncbi:MAG: hypothetical protein QM640_11310 [Niabella sp.]